MKEYGFEWDHIIGVSNRRDRTSLLWTDGRGKQKHVSSPATITFDRVTRDNGLYGAYAPIQGFHCSRGRVGSTSRL